MSEVRDGVGTAGAGKYLYQAGRAAQGLGTTTRFTAGMDLLSGATGMGTAANVGEVASAASSGAKGAVGAARISSFARIAGYAGQAAPVLARGSAVLGGALGAVEVGQGIHSFSRGDSERGTEQVVSGGADIVTAGALGVAATSSATVVGLPVAAVALGVAGVAQGAKYAYKYREQIGDAAGWVGNQASRAAGAAGDVLSAGANRLKDAWPF